MHLWRLPIDGELSLENRSVSTEDLFASLSGGKVFSKLDLSHAYQKLKLDKKSQNY